MGGQVPVTINIAYPAKWFNKNAVVTITPVLRYATGETWGTAYTYQGEKVRANNPMIRYGLDWLLDLLWGLRTEENTNISRAELKICKISLLF